MARELSLELAWDRTAKPVSQQSTHYLRLRIVPADQTTSALPLRIAVALDTSRSMEEDNRLQHAQDACLEAAERLGRRDTISLAGYSKDVQELTRDTKAGPMMAGRLKLLLSELRAKGVTRSDLALHWLAGVLAGRAHDTARVAVLITDGFPTDEMGYELEDLSNLLNQARNLGQAGVVLCTIGLGDAAGFNGGFLNQLSEQGRGRFIYAQEPGGLAYQLSSLFGQAKQLGASECELTVTGLVPGVELTGACRVRPEFAALEFTGQQAHWTIQTGALPLSQPTDVLLRLEVPSAKFGAGQEVQEIVNVQAKAGVAKQELRAGLKYTTSYAQLRELAADVDRDRLIWEMNSYAAQLPSANEANQTVALLEALTQSADGAGATEVATEARVELARLKQTGVIRKHNATTLLSRVKQEGEQA